jgi:hypothetical protein
MIGSSVHKLDVKETDAVLEIGEGNRQAVSQIIKKTT